MKHINRYRLLVFLVMPFLLSWPAWFNGQPFLFADTTAYIKGAASAASLVVRTDLAAAWLAPHPARAATAAGAGTPPAATEEHSSAPDKGGVIAGRSIYYGFFVFFTACLLGLKCVPLLQALISTCLIVSILRAGLVVSYRTIAVTLLLLAVASPLPFFNSLLMPDIFAGLGIASAVALVMMPLAPRPWRLFWVLLLLSAVLFHTGNILIVLATIVALVLLSLLVHRGAAPGAAGVLLALSMVALGVGGESLFNYAVGRITHSAPIRPPFMTARLLADGPGNEFVAHDCAGRAFEVCNYRRDFARHTSDDFLWSLNPAIGVFTLAPKAVRERLGQQDFAFARAVFLRYPGAVIEHSLRNIGAQLSDVGLTEYVYTPFIVQSFTAKLPAAEFDALQGSRAARGRFKVLYSERIIKVATAVALLVCLGAAARCLARKDREGFVFIAIFLLSLLINAGVCGALSTPHDRYQARIAWIPELLALVVLACRHGIMVRRSASTVSTPAESR